ncbi:hypothetical protein BH24ACT5_BH24ACT5_08750 [soil metagenome]
MSTATDPHSSVAPARPDPAELTMVRRSPADRRMRRLLRLPVDGRAGTAADAQRAFQTSMMVAAVRCVLMYLVFPFVLPAVGIARGIGPAVGLAVNTAAMVCIILSMRRFFRADHPKRWWYAALGGTVFSFLVYLAVVDLVDLLS